MYNFGCSFDCINSIETCLACLRSALSSWHLSSEFLSLRFSTLIFSTHWANSVLSTAIGELDLASVEMVMLVKSWKIWLKDNENTNIYMQIVSMYKDQSSRNLTYDIWKNKSKHTVYSGYKWFFWGEGKNHSISKSSSRICPHMKWMADWICHAEYLGTQTHACRTNLP